ncbi:MAG: ABC transporter permease [Saccharofermentanales bacterium]|jgi:oligopeptide transport system permease protein
MIIYTAKRFILAIITILVIITITFVLMHSIPGDPFTDEKTIPPDIMANLKARYGLDKPLTQQYFTYLRNLLKGDFGMSLKFKGRTVNEMLAQGFPVSLKLGLVAAAFGVSVGLLFGIISGINRGKLPDYLVIILAILGVSVPAFVFASLLQYVFAVKIKWFPVSGWNGPIYLILPALALGLRMIAQIARMMRTSMLDIMGQDYIKAARSKGLHEAQVIYRHALRNAILPVVTVAGVMMAYTLVGSFVVENIFSIPGMGNYLVTAVKQNDYTVILGITTFYAIIMVSMMFLVDIMYMVIDPRIRLDKKG